jgi:hypothetical protein
MFITTSEYVAKKADGTIVILKINIGTPEPDPLSNEADYRCKVEIPVLSFSEYAYGIDAVQSLCLGVQCLRYVLEPLTLEGWKFYCPKDVEHELDLIAVLFPTYT